MKTIQITCLDHFVEVTSPDRAGGRLFRGVPDLAAHPLVAPLGRRPRWSSLSRRQLTREERGMLERFKQEGAPHVAGRPSDWDWLVLAHEHGLPARLLDWSRNPLVALYFAVQGGIDRPGAVYAERFPAASEVDRKLDPFRVRKVSTVTPAQADARQVAQASVLTLHPDPRAAYRSRSLRCLAVSGKLKRHCKEALRRLGVHPATLFPGLAGVAASIVA